VAVENDTVSIISNIILFGLAPSTSGTSNISCRGSVGSNDVKTFIDVAYVQLVEDLVNGGGTYTEAVASLSGCSPLGHTQLVARVRGQMAEVLGEGLEPAARRRMLLGIFELTLREGGHPALQCGLAIS